METFSALLAICAGNSPVPGELPTQRPMTWSFDVFFDLRPNKRLSKHWWGWWLEMPSCPLWRHCNDSAGLSQKHWGSLMSVILNQIMYSTTKWPINGSMRMNHMNGWNVWTKTDQPNDVWYCYEFLIGKFNSLNDASGPSEGRSIFRTAFQVMLSHCPTIVLPNFDFSLDM